MSTQKAADDAWNNEPKDMWKGIGSLGSGEVGRMGGEGILDEIWENESGIGAGLCWLCQGVRACKGITVSCQGFFLCALWENIR